MSLFVWIAAAAPAAAQDALSVWGGLQLPATIESEVLLPDAEEPTAQFAAYGLRLLTPPIRTFDGRWLWVNGATLSRVHPTVTAAALPDATSNDMNTLAWDLLSIASLTDRWTAVAWVSSGLYSNFAAPLSGRDFRI